MLWLAAICLQCCFFKMLSALDVLPCITLAAFRIYSGTLFNQDTSINRTTFVAPNAMFVYIITPEIRTLPAWPEGVQIREVPLYIALVLYLTGVYKWTLGILLYMYV